MSEHLVAVLAMSGGVASWGRLRAQFSARTIYLAVAAGEVERIRRDAYALPGLAEVQHAATRLNGVVSHRSAALQYGWGVWTEPGRPELILPRGRRIRTDRRRGTAVRFRELAPGDVVDGRTAPVRTVVDCARDLPLVESLAVVDSALRSGAVTPDDLAAAAIPRTGRAPALRVLSLGSGRAANPFESALRAVGEEVAPGLFTPQGEVGLDGVTVHPDLVCVGLGIVIEADSFTFHTSRAQIDHDCWRYDELTLAGWLVLRFTWTQVRYHPEWVKATILQAVRRRTAGAA